MKLQDPKREHPIFDVAPGLAQALIAQGYHEIKAVQQPPKAAGQLNWWCVDGPIEGDYVHPPEIRFKCGECMGQYPGAVTSINGTAHKTARVFHCGMPGNVCPQDVADEYAKKFAAWKARSRKPPVDRISPHTPQAIVSRFGLKWRDELIADAVSALHKGPANGK